MLTNSRTSVLSNPKHRAIQSARARAGAASRPCRDLRRSTQLCGPAQQYLLLGLTEVFGIAVPMSGVCGEVMAVVGDHGLQAAVLCQTATQRRGPATAQYPGGFGGGRAVLAVADPVYTPNSLGHSCPAIIGSRTMMSELNPATIPPADVTARDWTGLGWEAPTVLHG